ncbi:MAG: acetate--CoA ligase family protein [Planctomycetes bacterium]|nr:acetate--CoA ligase family protein [Planctomycetota bacterium]
MTPSPAPRPARLPCSFAELDRFFNPRSIVLVGASDKPGKVGTAILENLLFGRAGARDRTAGFAGNIYPVNAKGGTLFGRPAWATCAEIKETPDLAVIAVAPPQVPDTVDQLGRLGVRAISIISGGFSEMGPEGHALQEEVVRRARAHGARLIGPNTLGIMRPAASLNASFAATMPPRGNLGFVSQSGALVVGLVEYAVEECIGFSKIVSIGDKSDLDDVDLLRYLAEDPETSVITLYIEALRDGRAFFEEARRVARLKPIVVYKSGRSAGGAKAAASHTGALAGNDAAYGAAFKQAGVYRANTVYDLVDAAVALARQPLPAGNRIAVLTNAGGPGVVCADEISLLGMSLAQLAPPTLAALDACCPPIWSRNNPVDIIGDAGPTRYEKALEALLVAPEVDGVVFVCTPQAMTEPLATAERVVRAVEAAPVKKPLTASFLGVVHKPCEEYLDAHGIPERAFPERAVRAMDALVRRAEYLRRHAARAGESEAVATHFDPALGRYLAHLRGAGRKRLTLAEARQVFTLAGIPQNASALARSAEEAAESARAVGFPVVVKVVAEQVSHKTEAGGVKVGLRTAEEVARAYDEIMRSVRAAVPEATIEGVSVDEMVTGPELILGSSVDPLFGKLIMFGVGGIYVEIYKDVAFRLAPVTIHSARAMIEEIKGRAILEGARGLPRADKEALAQLVVRIGDLVAAFPDLAELDVNPLVITRDGMKAVDARVVLA